MTIKLQLKTEVQSRLLARVRGLLLEEYLEQVLQEHCRTIAPPNISLIDKASAFETWARSQALMPPLSDRAIRRERLIRDA